MLDTTIEVTPGTQAAGVLLEPCGQELSSGYFLAIEPLKERVVFDRWPTPMDPLWESLVLIERHGMTVKHEIDTPLVERPLAYLPKDNRYQIRILRKGSLVECYVAEQVVASFRIYETSDTLFGLFVQEGRAEFSGLRLLKG